jgi:hypothetical protein
MKKKKHCKDGFPAEKISKNNKLLIIIVGEIEKKESCLS